jgi:hypothetical protein
VTISLRDSVVTDTGEYYIDLVMQGAMRADTAYFRFSDWVREYTSDRMSPERKRAWAEAAAKRGRELEAMEEARKAVCADPTLLSADTRAERCP